MVQHNKQCYDILYKTYVLNFSVTLCKVAIICSASESFNVS